MGAPSRTDTGTPTVLKATSVTVFTGLIVVTFSVQPSATTPASPVESSRTYKAHVPLGLAPLNAESAELYGARGAGSGIVTSCPAREGRKEPLLNRPALGKPAAAASSKVRFRFVAGKLPPL